MRIGIIGAGRIGGGLAEQLTRSGHEVLLSFSRDTRRLEDLGHRLGPGAAVGTGRTSAGIPPPATTPSGCRAPGWSSPSTR
jgi:predicted dinucleotide-binding enzyme